MPNGQCTVSDCTTTGRLRGGLCGACYQWSQKNPGADPAGRPRPTRAPADGQCTVTEADTKCIKAHLAHGMCSMHLKRSDAHGNPLTTLTRAKGTLLVDLTAAAFAETDDCIFLAGYASRPSVPFNGVTMFASRAVWIIRYGDPGPDCVLHTCNGGSGKHGCINIRHLMTGTKARNTQDSVNSGTWRSGNLRGEQIGNSVLTEAQAAEVLRRWTAGGVTQKALASEYGVSRALLSLLVNGKRWAHLG